MAMVRCCDADRKADQMSVGGLVEILMKMQFNEVLVPPHVKNKLYTEEAVARTVRHLLEDHTESQIQAQGYQLVIDSIFPSSRGLSSWDKAEPAPLRASSPPRLLLCGESAFQRRLGRLKTTSTISGVFEEEKDETDVQATVRSWFVDEDGVDENEVDTEQEGPIQLEQERQDRVKQVEERRVDLVEETEERESNTEEVVEEGHQHIEEADATQEERREPTGTCGEQEQESEEGEVVKEADTEICREEGEISGGEADMDPNRGQEHIDTSGADGQSSGSAEPVADMEVYDLRGNRLLGGTSWSVVVAGVPKGSSTSESLQELAELTLSNLEFISSSGSSYKHFVRGVTICEGCEDDSAIVYFCSEVVSEMFLQICQHDFQISGKKLGFARNFTPTRLIGRMQGPVIYLSRIPKGCDRDTLISHFTNIVRGDSGDVKASQEIVLSADVFPATTDGYVELVGHWAVDLVFYRCKKNVKLLQEVGQELCLFRGNSYIPQRYTEVHAEICRRNGEKTTETGLLEAATPGASGVKRHAADNVQPECKRHKPSPSAAPEVHAEDAQGQNNHGTGTPHHAERRKRQTRFDMGPPLTPPPGFENYCPFQSDIRKHSSSPGIRSGSSDGLSPPPGFGCSDRQRTLFVYNPGSAWGLEQAVLSLLRSLRRYPVDRDVIKRIHLGERNTALICFRSERLADDVMDAYILNPGAAEIDGQAFCLYRHFGYIRPMKNDQVITVNIFTPSTATLLGLSGIPFGIQELALKGAVTELLERLLVYSGFRAQPRTPLLTSFNVSGDTAYAETRSAAELDFLMAVDAPLVLAGRRLTLFRPSSY